MARVATETEQERFLDVLVKYLVGDAVKMSIGLQLNKPEAHQWAEMRGTTPLFGYPTPEEAKDQLRIFLFNREK